MFIGLNYLLHKLACVSRRRRIVVGDPKCELKLTSANLNAINT
jgi:hypothetical protein